MKFSKEMIEKAKSAASAEELVEMAKAEGIKLSADDAAKYFDFLHGSHELSDDEVQEVAGGKGEDSTPGAKFSVGQTVVKDWSCNTYYTGTITANNINYLTDWGWEYSIHYYKRKDNWGNITEIDSNGYEYLERPDCGCVVY